MKHVLVITIPMLIILAVSMVPQAFSFCIPPNPASDDGKWELFGPHITGIRIHVYSDLTAEMNDMGVGQLDLEDWALDTAHATSWSTSYGPITLQNYGGEAGYYVLDINNNATLGPVGGPYVHNPTSELTLRRAIAACVNRSYMVDYTGGMALPIYTPVPSYMAGYINPEVALSGAPSESIWAGYKAISNSPTFTDVTAKWKVPEITATGKAAVDIFAGIGGAKSAGGGAIIQAGTELMKDEKGNYVYQVWYENYPADQKYCGTITPGHDVSVTISLKNQATNTWTVNLVDNSEVPPKTLINEDVDCSKNPPNQKSAEWITAESHFDDGYDLPNFKSVDLKDCGASENMNTEEKPINSYTNEKSDIIHDGYIYTSTGALSKDGRSFTTTYETPRKLSYNGYDGDLDLANALLNDAGYTWQSGHAYRTDPNTGLDLNLIVYSRDGDRGAFGDDLVANLNAVGIGTDYHSHVSRGSVTGPVLTQQYFNLYTGAWTNVGPDPDYLCDLYNGSNYYHPGSPPNYDNVNYPETNANATAIKLAPDLPTGLNATLDFQWWFAYYAAAVPVWSYSGVKGYKNVPRETSTSMAAVTYPPNGDWKHLVNEKGVGVNSWWSTLDMQTYGNLYPNLNAWYGFSSTVQLQNIVYSQWYWDMEVLGRIYDGGWGRGPYTLLWGVPQLYDDYKVGTWVDPVTHETKTSVTVTLRPDVYWQDGQPFTAADVLYTLVEVSKDLLAKGFPPPWWYPTVQYVRSVELIDPYNIQVLLDVYSVWAAGWVLGSVVIPKHIWKPIVDASINDGVHNYIQGVTPDPNIIGTGPFRWVSGVGDTVGSTIVLTANTPGSVVGGITSPGYYLYCPVYADINPINSLSKVNVLPSDPSVTVPVTLTLRNLWTDGSLVVNKYAFFGRNLALVNGGDPSTLVPGYPKDVTLNQIYPYPLGPTGVDVEYVNVTLVKKLCPYYLKLAVHIKGPSTITYTEAWGGTTVTYTIPDPWISSWVNVTIPLFITIKQDIVGTDWYTVMGLGTVTPSYIKNELPAPDQKVDIKDIAAGGKAFGAIPGSPFWNTVADVNGDFKIDIKDIANIAKQFGY